MTKDFNQHIELRIKQIRELLVENSLDALYFDNGFPDYYYLDDQPTFFKPNPHFNFLCPDPGPGHVIKVSVDQDKPKLFYYIPDDFWHEVSMLKGDFWEESFDITVVSDTESLWKKLSVPGEKSQIVSPNSRGKKHYELSPAPDSIINQLHWLRSQKTEYEISCVKKANEKASFGHKKAKELFFSGATELDVFNHYLLASGQREPEIPYNSIVAFNQNSAILHYQFPKPQGTGKTFLIDAGARYNGYCSDITRTYFTDDVHPAFKQAWQMVEENQNELCLQLKPGVDYVEIHRGAYNNVAKILVETKLSKVSEQELLDKKIPFFFFPHGIGHPLGLQVHDVGAKQKSKEGDNLDQPVDFPYLRNLREIQENEILTIEPGFYVNPLLMEELCKQGHKDLINWDLADKLYPLGGIRIEDDVVARSNGPENLTRPYVD